MSGRTCLLPMLKPCSRSAEGQVEYLRTRLLIGSLEIQVLHFLRPGSLDLVAMTDGSEDEQDLPPLPWFGPGDQRQSAYQSRRLALDGAQAAPEVDVTNAALNSLLDLLEDRVTTWPAQPQAVTSGRTGSRCFSSLVMLPRLSSGDRGGGGDR